MEKIKSGYLNLETGLVFCHYGKGYPNGEYWITPYQYEERTRKRKEKHQERYASDEAYKQRILARSKSTACKQKAKERTSKEQYKTKRSHYIKQWVKRKINSGDKMYSFTRRIRARLKFALKQKKLVKSKKSEIYLGAKVGKAREFIESQFADGMSWKNRSKWHIDHFFPIAMARNEKDIYPLVHYTNLRPLWASENVKKSDTFPTAKEIIERDILLDKWINKQKLENAKN
jgi:hypothetical protein